MAYLLRHDPKKAGLTLDKDGWVTLAEFVQKSGIEESDIREIVKGDTKGRYSIDVINDVEHIRANQGHSTNVELKFEKKVPPVQLYHGTSVNSYHQIMKTGLLPMSRHHVHLSADVKTAETVAARRKGELVVLSIDAKSMLADGYSFYISANGVWLADTVPPEYITIY